MHFSDITLDGLMKEFEKISQANASEESTYTLPETLLDQDSHVADVPFYDELLKSTASERSKLYGVVADTDMLNEAHPGGSVQPAGLSGELALVEDQKTEHAKFEAILNAKVKDKKAQLHGQLLRLASALSEKGYTDLSDKVVSQVLKIADDYKLYASAADGEFAEGDIDAHVAAVSTEFKNALEMLLNGIEYGAMNSLSDDLKKSFVDAKLQAPELADMMLRFLQDDDKAEAMKSARILTNLLRPFVLASKGVPVVVKAIAPYKAALSKVLVMIKPSVDGAEKRKTDVAGMATVGAVIDLFEQKLMAILPGSYTGTIRTWADLDKDLRKYFKLFPSNVSPIPAGGKTYKNWSELGDLVREGIAEWQMLSDGFENKGETLESKLKRDEAGSIDIDALRGLLNSAPAAAPEKGAPVSPEIPLSMSNPARTLPNL